MRNAYDCQGGLLIWLNNKFSQKGIIIGALLFTSKAEKCPDRLYTRVYMFIVFGYCILEVS